MSSPTCGMCSHGLPMSGGAPKKDAKLTADKNKKKAPQAYAKKPINNKKKR